MEKGKKKKDNIVINPKGQSGMLQRILKQTYAIIIVAVLCLAVFIGFTLYSDSCKEEQLENTVYLNQYRLGSKTLTSAVQSYAVTGDEEFYDAYMKELNEDKNRDIAKAGLKENNLKEDEWEQLESISEMSNGLVPLEEEAMREVQNGDTKAAQKAVFGDSYQKTVSEINSVTTECIDNIQARMQKQQNIVSFIKTVSMFIFLCICVVIIVQITRVMNFAKRELLVPIVKVSELIKNLAQGNFQNKTDMVEDESEVGIMVAAINFMNNNFTRMISEISEVLGEMGSGNYNVEVKEHYVGDFAEIKDSMVKIIEDTKETLSTIRNAADEIGSGSEQLANAASDLAEGCTVQAEKVTEVSQTIDNMRREMEEKTKETYDTVAISTNAGELLVQSNDKMNELKDAIGEINHCSEEIRTIIGVIEDIASQTNLLSLNASIEAARAGEAGRGFAVVAEQVKNLAEQSTEAAGQTTKLIQSTIEAVEKGMLISDEAVKNMNEVMIGAKEATEKMSLIADVMKAEAKNMNDINDDVSKIAEIVDNNSASSEETAAVSEEQSAHVQTMVHMMEKFNI